MSAIPDAAVPPSGEAGRDRAFEEGFLIGVLVGEGHFGGDGKQPQVTLRMHARHATLFEWIQTRFPGGALYGPYTHSGRNYYQWMARGRYLRETLLPILQRRLGPELDRKTHAAFLEMLERYRQKLAPGESASTQPPDADDPGGGVSRDRLDPMRREPALPEEPAG